MTNDVDEYLKECARWVGTTPKGVLRRVLHLEKEPGFSASLFPNAPASTLVLFEDLDQAISIRNPGFHYVRRATYLGYRREASGMESKVGERSQVFVSLVTGQTSRAIRAVLPLDPAPYVHLDQASDLRGMGHHGIGELKFTISEHSDITLFTEVFHDWLCLRSAKKVPRR